MAQIPSLENAPLNLAALRDQSQKELISLLKNIRGPKCLAIDPSLAGTISLLIPTTQLMENGTELRQLSSSPIETECLKVVFLVRSRIDLMEFVARIVQDDVAKGVQKEYFIYFVPRRTVACEKILQEEKVHQLLNIGEYPLFLIPLDEDVISFELDTALKDYLLDGDTTSIWHVARAIHKLEFSFGVIPNVSAKGKASTKVANLLIDLQTEDPVSMDDIVVPEISTLILLDREVDMVTPMCSQLTYEGLLDEVLGIKNGSVEVDAKVLNPQDVDKKVKVPLNSSDKLYKEVRDLSPEVVVKILRQKATSMREDYVGVKTIQTQISELKDFVKKLNSLPEIARHVSLAEELQKYTSKPSFHARLDMEQTILELQNFDICFEYIEEMIHKQEPIASVLRLLILLSLTNSGLPKGFDNLRREILHSYGFEHMELLYKLEKAGLVKKQESKSNWQTITKAFQLIVDVTATPNIEDISYVFSGYAPLSIRLVQHAIRSGWRTIQEPLKLLPGPHSDTKRSSPPGNSFLKAAGAVMQSPIGRVADGHRPVVLVVFIGGVTFAEISALRFLSSQEGMGCDFIVATTKVVNGTSLLRTFDRSIANSSS